MLPYFKAIVRGEITMRRHTHDRLVKEALADPEIKVEYDSLAEEFDLLRKKACSKFQETSNLIVILC